MNKGFFKTTLILICLYAFGKLVAFPDSNRVRGSNPSMRCNTFNATIHNAADKYLNDNHISDTKEITIDKLIEKNYIKFNLKCPSNGIYTILYKISNVNKIIVDKVVCSVHGELPECKYVEEGKLLNESSK